MNSKFVFLSLLVFAFVSVQIAPTEANELQGLIANELIKLYKTGDFKFLGHSCVFRRSPTVRKWELKWEGKVWCPGFAPINGRAVKSSRSGSIEAAIQDYARKVVDAGLAKPAEVQVWLKP